MVTINVIYFIKYSLEITRYVCMTSYSEFIQTTIIYLTIDDIVKSIETQKLLLIVHFLFCFHLFLSFYVLFLFISFLYVFFRFISHSFSSFRLFSLTLSIFSLFFITEVLLSFLNNLSNLYHS